MRAPRRSISAWFCSSSLTRSTGAAPNLANTAAAPPAPHAHDRRSRRRRTASASADQTAAKSAWWESGGRSIVGRAANRRASAELTKRNPSASADLLDSIWGIG